MHLIWPTIIIGTFIAAFYLGGRFYFWLEYDDEVASQHRVLIPLAIAGVMMCLFLAIILTN